jgi:ABC-type transport system substrate-binding protein
MRPPVEFTKYLQVIGGNIFENRGLRFESEENDEDHSHRSMGKEFEVSAIWLIDQWRQIGLNVKQTTHDLATAKRDLQTGNFEVYIDALSDYMDEPDLQFIGLISRDKSPKNYGRYIDRTLDDLYEKQSKAMNPAERKKLCHQFEKRVLDEMAYCLSAPWRHRIVHYSAKVKGWKALPSHFLNLDLTNVWLTSKD